MAQKSVINGTVAQDMQDAQDNFTELYATKTEVENARDSETNLLTKIQKLVAFSSGTHASRPSAGTAGRVYFSTDIDLLSYDDGSTWHEFGLLGNSRFSVYLATTAQDIPNNTWTQINFNAESEDNLNEFDSSSNYRFTATYDGSYVFHAHAAFLESLADGSWHQIALYKNNTVTYYGTKATVGSADNPHSQISAYLSLSAGDYIDVRVRHNHGDAREINTGSSTTYFMGYRFI